MPNTCHYNRKISVRNKLYTIQKRVYKTYLHSKYHLSFLEEMTPGEWLHQSILRGCCVPLHTK